jgi:LacI family transcriptional regulator
MAAQRKQIHPGIPIDQAWQEGRRLYVATAPGSRLDKDLLTLGSTWDDARKARWVGSTKSDGVVAALTADVERLERRQKGPAEAGQQERRQRVKAGQQRATLQMIADAMGVHVSTVSRVLNKPKDAARTAASGATAERIRERATELGYRLNPQAASLRTLHTNLIGVLVPRLTDVVLAMVYEGIEAAAATYGLTAFVANTQDVSQREHVQMMLDRRVDGLILGDANSGEPEALASIAQKVPTVLVNRSVGDYPSVTCDNYLGGRLAAEHLLELGHTRVGVIAGLPHASTGIDRPAGFVDRYREAGIEVPPSHILYTGLDSTGGHIAADRLLKAEPRITGLFAVNDFAAIGAMGAVRDRGLRLGQDIALIGFNNIPLAGELWVPLTSIDSSAHEMGRMAMDMLSQILDGHTVTHKRTQPQLVIRASSAPDRHEPHKHAMHDPNVRAL